MAALQKKIKQLRREEKALQESVTEKMSAVASAIEEYAKVDCRAFCEEVYNRFTLEMREMIYGYMHAQREVPFVVLQRNRVWHSISYLANISYFDSASEAHWRGCTRGRSPDHWWNPEFMGALMVRELSVNYFRTVCIIFDTEFQSIPKFRITDQWGLRYTPSEIIANVGVTIRCGFYDFKDLEPRKEIDQWCPSDSFYHESPPRREPTSKLLSELELLFGFRQGTKISLRIWAERALKGSSIEKQRWMLDTILPFISPTLGRLEKAGYKVRVMISTRGWNYKGGDFTLEGSAALRPEEAQKIFNAVSHLDSMLHVYAMIVTVVV